MIPIINLDKILSGIFRKKTLLWRASGFRLKGLWNENWDCLAIEFVCKMESDNSTRRSILLIKDCSSSSSHFIRIKRDTNHKRDNPTANCALSGSGGLSAENSTTDSVGRGENSLAGIGFLVGGCSATGRSSRNTQVVCDAVGQCLGVGSYSDSGNRETEWSCNGWIITDRVTSWHTSDANIVLLVTEMSSCNCNASLTSVISKITHNTCLGESVVIEILKASRWATTVPVLTCVLWNMDSPSASCTCGCSINQCLYVVASWTIWVQDHVLPCVFSTDNWRTLVWTINAELISNAISDGTTPSCSARSLRCPYLGICQCKGFEVKPDATNFAWGRANFVGTRLRGWGVDDVGCILTWWATTRQLKCTTDSKSFRTWRTWCSSKVWTFRLCVASSVSWVGSTWTEVIVEFDDLK